MTNTYESLNLLIDSSQRMNLNEPICDFTAMFSKPLNINMARLKSWCIPYTWYNVTSANNTFTFNGTQVLTIPNGNYAWNTLIDAIIAAGTSKTPTASASLNVATGLTTLTFGSATTISGGLTGLLQLLGFQAADITGSFTSFTSSLLPQFFTTDYLKLSIKYLDGNNITVNNVPNNMTFLIENPISYSNFVIGDKIMSNDTAQFTGCKSVVFPTAVQLQNTKITLTDANDNVLDLNGVDWWCIVELIYPVSIDNYQPQTTPYVPPPPATAPNYMNNNTTPLVKSTKPVPQFLWMS